MNCSIMEREIFSQEKVLKNTYDTNLLLVENLAAKIKNKDLNQIVVVARGSSNNACMYFKYLCEIYVGIPVNFVHPSIITQYNGKLSFRNSLVIGVSQSGKAFDVSMVLKEAYRQGALTVAITNDLASPMALDTQYHFYLDVDKEESAPATKTFTAEMLLLEMIVEALLDENNKLPVRNSKIVDLVKETLKCEDRICAVTDSFIKINDVHILARGLNLAIANEFALKLQETCYMNAMSHAISDFYHGSIALVNETSHIIIIAMMDKVYADALEMIKRLRPLNAVITIITDNEELAAHCDHSILLPTAGEQITPFAVAVASQLFACDLSVKRGINPDAPRGMKKGISTR